MDVRHYNRNGQPRRMRMHPDAELAANLAAREANRPAPIANLRGAGVVSPPHRVKASRPRHVRRNQGYYAANGAFIAYAEAPYLEFVKDVQRRHRTPSHSVRTISTATAPVSVAKSYQDRLDKYGAVGNNADA